MFLYDAAVLIPIRWSIVFAVPEFSSRARVGRRLPVIIAEEWKYNLNLVIHDFVIHFTIKPLLPPSLVA